MPAVELTIERPLRAWLMARDTRLSAVVYPGMTTPGRQTAYCTYTRVSSQTWGHLKGQTGVSRARVQLDVFSLDHSEARSIADKIDGSDQDKGLRGYRGLMNGVFVQAALRADQGEGSDPVPDSSENVWHVIRLEYSITWNEVN